MDTRRYTAVALSEGAVQSWAHHTALEGAEPLLAVISTRPSVSVADPASNETRDYHSPSSPESPGEAARRHLAQSLVDELDSQWSLCRTSEAELAYVELTSVTVVEPRPPPEEAIVVPTHLTDPHPPPENAIVPTRLLRYKAESMVEELLNQQSYSLSCDAEARYTEILQKPQEAVSDVSSVDVPIEPCPPHEEAILVPTHIARNIAESLVDELLSQQSYSLACDAEARFTEVNHEPTVTSVTPEVAVEVVEIQTKSIGVCTVPRPLRDVYTSMEPRPLVDAHTSMEPRPLREVGCNTLMNCLDVLRRAKEMEELHMLRADHHIAVKQLNEQRSQRMVAEQLVKIIQSDLSNLRQKNVSEVTTRMRLENELGDVKGELTHANRQLQEKDERIHELEESLTGTALLVRKLEEQNTVTLMNRGGIDYMVQAKLAEGRAREAEQKLEVAQAELLQSQTEVRVLLERVGEAARDKSESVSSKVHTQLLQLADERALAAEKRAQDLESEVRTLKNQLSTREASPNDPYGLATRDPYGLATRDPYGLATRDPYGLATRDPYGLATRDPYGLATRDPYGLATRDPYGLSTRDPYGLDSGKPTTTYGLSYGSTVTTQPLAGLSSLYPSGTTTSTQSHDSSTYLLPSSIKSHDYLGTSQPKSHDYLGTSQPKSHDYLGTSKPKSHDYLETSKPKSHDSSLKLGSHDQHAVSHDLNPKPKVVDLPVVSTIVSETREKEESGSSDWSSSDEESSNPLAPSHHRSLISQWEWRARNPTEGEVPSQATPGQGEVPSRRKPPPIAPKPKHLLTSDRIAVNLVPLFEPASSFNEPVHKPSLVTSKRVKGPRGRRLPVRFSKQISLFS